MQCPACNTTLSQVTVRNITLDVCKGGCGGIWFDKEELERFDEEIELIAEDILLGEKGMQVVVDYNKARPCPKCSNSVLQRCYVDSEKKILVDTCLLCGGIWLDPGELYMLRSDNAQRDEREQVLKAYFSDPQRQEELKKLPQKFSAIFRLLFR